MGEWPAAAAFVEIDPHIHGAMPPAPAVRTVPHLHGGQERIEEDGVSGELVPQPGLASV